MTAPVRDACAKHRVYECVICHPGTWGEARVHTVPERDSMMMVREFHEAYGVPVRTSPTTDISAEERVLRVRLVLEEAFEFCAAMGCRVEVAQPEHVNADTIEVEIDPTSPGINLVESADALADIEYVVNGSALCLGIPQAAVVREVHRSNMSKLGEDGKPIYREGDGKVLKGPGYFKPDIAAVLRDAP